MASGDVKKDGPNILVSGTPGTGKTRFVKELLKRGVGLEHIEISKLALDRNLISEMDTDRNVPVIDEDAVLDELEPVMARGNKILEYHCVEFFPERWFDRVIVLTTNNTILYDRLRDRGYSEAKIQENVECEIFQVLVEEASGAYDEKVVAVFKNDTESDLAQNVNKVIEWITEFRESHC